MELVNYVRNGEQGVVIKQKMPPSQSPVVANVMDRAGNLTEKLNVALPHGWKLRLETTSLGVVDDPDPEEEFNFLVKSDNEGGSFAEVKLETLRAFPSLCATGFTPDEILERMVERLVQEDYQSLYDAISPYRNCPALPKTVEKFLRSHYHITGYAGGIRIPLRIHKPQHGIVKNSDLLASFSGGSGEQDLFLATSCARAFIDSYRHHFPAYCVELDLKQLEQHPLASFYIKLCGIS